MRVPTVAVLTLAGLGLAVGGCAGTEPGASGPTTSTTRSSAPEPTVSGTATGCMVGTWRTTQVSGRAASAVASGSISGGTGATVTISQNGRVLADFSGMQPLSFTAEVSGNAVAGSATYGGQGTATIKASATTSTATTDAPASAPAVTPGTPPVPSATPQTTETPTALASATAAAAAEEGTWEPIGKIDWSALRLTLELTKPVEARLLDNAPIGDYIGDAANQSGQAIETDPILGAGAYSCQGSTLTLKGDTDTDGLTWTLTKI
ncbi:hypothetical protein ACFQ1L_45285 [Phytohabitans flavus]|uniref:hypothetical protein n=1 Tax=Phytohabitans flavus TaxID=1076124 RepID=UPI00363A5FDD